MLNFLSTFKLELFWLMLIWWLQHIATTLSLFVNLIPDFIQTYCESETWWCLSAYYTPTCAWDMRLLDLLGMQCWSSILRVLIFPITALGCFTDVPLRSSVFTLMLVILSADRDTLQECHWKCSNGNEKEEGDATFTGSTFNENIPVHGS